MSTGGVVGAGVLGIELMGGFGVPPHELAGPTTMVVSSVQRPQLLLQTLRSIIHDSSQVPHSTHCEQGRSGRSSLMSSVQGTTMTSGSAGIHSVVSPASASSTVDVGLVVLDCAGGATGVGVGEMGLGLGEPGFGFTAGGCVGTGLTASVESEGMARSTVCASLSEQAASRTRIAGVVTKVERMWSAS